jgi:acetyl-CoA carboxylase carboxyl transferase subunit alpha
MTYLEFEKPVQALQEEMERLQEMAEKNGLDLTGPIQEVARKIEETRAHLYANLTPWQRVQISRHSERPYALAYFDALTEGRFMELHGDRNMGDDKAMVGGLGTIDSFNCMLIGQQKGINTKMRQYRNFGMANPEGYRKALRLMRMAEKFGLPVVTFIDTPGAYPGLEAEERGQGEAIARNLLEMFKLKVPIICFIIGEGASGGALGIGIGDKVYMLENTWYSVISPESCSSILWRNWDHKEEAASALKLTATDMLNNKLIDGIIPEPPGGAHQNPDAAFAAVKKTLLEVLPKLLKMNPDKRIDARIHKFANMGVYQE